MTEAIHLAKDEKLECEDKVTFTVEARNQNWQVACGLIISGYFVATNDIGRVTCKECKKRASIISATVCITGDK